MIFLLILSSFPTLTLLWWLTSDRLLRSSNHRIALILRWIVGVSALFHVLGFAVHLASRISRTDTPLPTPAIASTYIWTMLTVPMLLLPWVLAAVGWWLIRQLHRLTAGTGVAVAVPEPAPGDEQEEVNEADPTPILSRRQALLLGTVALPPLINIAATGKALATMDHFRVREIEVVIPNLPAALRGYRIAHLSDTHAGRFTTGRQLEAIARTTNGLGADLIAVTGDIIDHSLEELPEAIRFMRALEAPDGVWACEGNHDLFQSRAGFEGGMKEAGVQLLVNETAVVETRGQRLEILGLRWGGIPGEGRRSAGIPENLALTMASSRPDADFKVLLAHHPDAFDAALESRIPLTLAGHTHGGQLMLTEHLGGGPALFRYWSGLYQQADSRLVVSNGTGNWFPLRMNAPAEIIVVKLA